MKTRDEFIKQFRVDVQKDLTPLQVQQYLAVLPHYIGEQALLVQEKEEVKADYKQGLEAMKASAYLKHKSENGKVTVAELEAMVTNYAPVRTAEMDLIKVDGELKQEEIQLEILNNMFVSMRKIASLVEAQLRTGN